MKCFGGIRNGRLYCIFVNLIVLTMVVFYSGVTVHLRRPVIMDFSFEKYVSLSGNTSYSEIDKAKEMYSNISKETLPEEKEKLKPIKTNTITKDLTRKLTYLNITLKPDFVAMFNTSDPEYAIDASFLIENPTLCSSVTNLTVLIIVHTAPSHFEHRQVIRKTWANNKCYINLGVVRILFLLGLVKDEHLQKGLEEEFRQHEDLLQGNFIDDYHNLTHKGVMAYKWITERCRNAKIILKTDDDVVVNMYLFLSKYAPISKERQISCRRHKHSIIERSRSSKWFVNENQFRNYTHYPAYCQGFMVMFTNDIIPDLYKSALKTPFFWIDDVFLYGFIPANVPDIHYNTIQQDKKKSNFCFKSEIAIKNYQNKKRKFDYLAVVGNYRLSKEIWRYMTQRQITDRNSTCDF